MRISDGKTTRHLAYHVYEWVLDNVLEHTALGYTLRSLDRVWVVVTFDDWSIDSDLHGNLIYAGVDGTSTYDIDDTTWCFFSRTAAEQYAEDRNSLIHESHVHWYIANLGDLARFDETYLNTAQLLRRGRFRGSDAVLERRAEIWSAESRQVAS